VLGLPESQTGVVMFSNSDHGMSIAKSVLAETLGGNQPAVNWQNYASIEDKAKRKSKSEFGGQKKRSRQPPPRNPQSPSRFREREDVAVSHLKGTAA
jgi:hypothetical protein